MRLFLELLATIIQLKYMFTVMIHKLKMIYVSVAVSQYFGPTVEKFTQFFCGKEYHPILCNMSRSMFEHKLQMYHLSVYSKEVVYCHTSNANI